MNNIHTQLTRSNLMFRIACLGRRWRNVLDSVFEPAGLTDDAWRLLLHIQVLGDGVRQKDLGESIGIEGPALVRLLEKLVEKGLLTRAGDHTDRRAKRLYLTPDGRILVGRICDVVTPLENELLSGFEETELSMAAAFVTRVEENAVDIGRRLKK